MTEIISAIRRGAVELITRSGGNSSSDGGRFDQALESALQGSQSAPDQGVGSAPSDDVLSDGDNASPFEQTFRGAQWRAAYGHLLAPGLAATAGEDTTGSMGIPGAMDTEGGSGNVDTEHVEDGQIAKDGKAAEAIGDARRAAGMGGGSLAPIPGRPAAAGVPTAGDGLTSAPVQAGTLSSVGADVLAPAGPPAGNGAAIPAAGAASDGTNAVGGSAVGGDVVPAEPGRGSAQAVARVVGKTAYSASAPTLPPPASPSALSVMSAPTATAAATASSTSLQAGQTAATAPAGAPPPANTTPAQPGLPITNGSPVLTTVEAVDGGFGVQAESAHETSLPAAATSRSATNDPTAPGSAKVGDAANPPNPAPDVPTASIVAHTAGPTEATMLTAAASAAAAGAGTGPATAASAPAATGAGGDAAESEADGDAASPQIDRLAAEGSRVDTDADDGSDSRRSDFQHRDFQHHDFQHHDPQRRDSSPVGVIPQGVARGERPVFEVPREMGRGAEGAAPITQNPSVTGAERVTPPPTFAPAAPPAPIAGAPAHTPLPAHSQVMQAVGPLLRGADGSYQISLHLDPAGLGRVRVQVEMRGGEVSIQMLAADGGARDMLRDNLDQLRAQFAEMGLKSGSLAVEAGGADGEKPWEGLDAHTDDDRRRGGGADATGHGAGDAAESTDPTIQRGPSGDGALDVRI